MSDDDLRQELADADALRERMATILTDTANALKGPVTPGHWPSWHDLAKVAAEVKQDAAEWKTHAYQLARERDEADREHRLTVDNLARENATLRFTLRSIALGGLTIEQAIERAEEALR